MIASNPLSNSHGTGCRETCPPAGLAHQYQFSNFGTTVLRQKALEYVSFELIHRLVEAEGKFDNGLFFRKLEIRSELGIPAYSLLRVILAEHFLGASVQSIHELIGRYVTNARSLCLKEPGCSLSKLLSQENEP